MWDDEFKDPVLDNALTSAYSWSRNNNWTNTNWFEEECSDPAYSKEVDNFPVYLPEQTLYLEAVFYIIPVRYLLIIETYTMLFEGFPPPRPECRAAEILFLTRLASNPTFGQKLLAEYAPHHPFRSSREIVMIYEYWKASQHDTHLGGTSGWIIFPPPIQELILQEVRSHLVDTSWQVQLLEQFVDYV